MFRDAPFHILRLRYDAPRHFFRFAAELLHAFGDSRHVLLLQDSLLRAGF